MKKIIITLSILFSLNLIGGEVGNEAILYRIQKEKTDKEIGVYVERVFNRRYSILSKTYLNSNELKELYQLVKKAEATEDSEDSFCGHDPGFALIVYKKNSIIYEGSYCFKCLTIGEPTKSRRWGTKDMKRGSDTEKVKEYLLKKTEKK